MEPDIIVGIDLGTTNSLVGAMDAGFPVLCADAEGRRLTPSVVSFPAAAGGDLPAAAPLVGWPAARQRVLRPRHTVFSVKRLMGLRSDDPAVREARAAGLPYEVVPAAGEPPGPVRVRVDGVDHAPEQIAALILGQLRADAARALGAPVRRAVITVPAYFNDAQRQATKTAGELAGLAVERILNEPTAAALAYGLDRLGERSRVAVYDLGGGTFDLSILELNQGVFEVLATNGHTRLGGDDIDAALTARLAARLGVPPGGDAFLALREQAHDAKVRLSTEPETTVALPFGLGAHGREGAAVVVTREELEELARPLVERTGWHCRRALADARLDPADLQAVVLVGGATRMPLVRRFAGELFGRDPDTTQHPDEAVARGAVIQAGVLAGSVRNVVLLDVIPLSLGLETFGGLTNVIIPRNTTIPAKAGEMFTNAVAGQTAVRLRVLQGERERARDNWTLGTFDLPFAPAPRAQARVGVQFSVDADGILTVLARDVRTGQEKVVQIERGAVDVSDEAVEKMIADSVEHAFDDYHDRLLTEAQLKAREMVPAARQALELVGPELAPAERARVQALVGALETALADPATDLERLRHATGELDAGTQDLATLLVERLLGQPGQS